MKPREGWEHPSVMISHTYRNCMICHKQSPTTRWVLVWYEYRNRRVCRGSCQEIYVAQRALEWLS